MTFGYPRRGTVLGSKVKGQGHRVSKFILHTRTLHTIAIHRDVASRLRFCSLVRASLTLARWRNH